MMLEQSHRKFWVDWYVNGDLSAEDTEAFETALLESSELQNDLETALALQGVFSWKSPEHENAVSEPRPMQLRSDPGHWHQLALAASVILAVVSTVMWWKTGNHAGDLERQVQALSLPVSEVLKVEVPIMRSAGSRTPDVIVQKPEGRAAVLLDIELGLAAREKAQLAFTLMDPEGTTVLAWQSVPRATGRATVVIPAAQIPASRLWLQINDSDGNILERRLLEFRDPN